MTKFRGTYEVDYQTQNCIRFRHRQLAGKPIRTSPAPYFYLKKSMWREMQEPEVIEIVVTPRLPEMEDE